MPQPNKIALLPETVRNELDQRLIRQAFSRYDELAAWLVEQGYEISRAAVGRHGRNLQDYLRTLKTATESAKAIVAEAGDEEGALNDALIRLMQERIFQILINLDVDDISEVNVPAMAKAVADLGKSSVAQKRWMSEIRAKAERAADEAAEIATKGGLTEAAAAAIRAKILGIAA